MSRQHNAPWRWKLALSFVATASAILLSEAGLRIFCDLPHPYTVDGTSSGRYVYAEMRQRHFNKYVPELFPATSRILRPNPKIMHGLSPEVHFTIDRFGFRGTQDVTVTKDLSTRRIIAVGGSTTECKFLDDSQTWSELLRRRLQTFLPKLEIINAGHSGHTTRDHIELLAQRLVTFNPDAILFLVGINDVELQLKPDYSILREDFRSLVDEEPPGIILLGKVRAADYSHIVRLAIWAKRRMQTEDQRGNPFQDEFGDWLARKRNELRRLPFRDIDPADYPTREYEQNLRTLIGICRAHGIEPLFITQPAIWGAPTGDWEENLWIHPHPDYRLTHDRLWGILESFNDVMRRLADEEHLRLIDLARKLPKSSDVFYDDDHFTVQGAQMIAETIALELSRAIGSTPAFTP